MPVLLSQQKREFHRFEANMKWFQDNYDSLRKEYPGKYVAVDNGKVQMHDKDARVLIKKLKDECKDTGRYLSSL